MKKERRRSGRRADSNENLAEKGKVLKVFTIKKTYTIAEIKSLLNWSETVKDIKLKIRIQSNQDPYIC